MNDLHFNLSGSGTKCVLDREFVLASVTTSHFEFEVIAYDKEHAATALLRAWKAHCRDYSETADPDYMKVLIAEGDVHFDTIRIGEVHRDGETISPA
jgi:hypothetical protein